MEDFTVCQHCGAEIRAEVRFCRHCGSSDSDGWSEDTEYEEEEFDYESYVSENFDDGKLTTSLSLHWKVVTLVLLSIFLLGFLFF